jgi:hypothetical protein
MIEIDLSVSLMHAKGNFALVFLKFLALILSVQLSILLDVLHRELISLSLQVFTFGSVPLKTYLPDGDIDVTAFSNSEELKEIWANLVRDALEREEKSENAEFHVKEVQYIQAEVLYPVIISECFFFWLYRHQSYLHMEVLLC